MNASEEIYELIRVTVGSPLEADCVAKNVTFFASNKVNLYVETHKMESALVAQLMSQI